MRGNDEKSIDGISGYRRNGYCMALYRNIYSVAVSYTHLDVYKRQVLGGRFCCQKRAAGADKQAHRPYGHRRGDKEKY